MIEQVRLNTLNTGNMRFDYQMVSYIAEDTPNGTGCKLELYCHSFVSELSPQELEVKYRNKMIIELKKRVGELDSDYGHKHFMILDAKPTNKPLSTSIEYTANVINIGRNTPIDKRYIRKKKGVLYGD